MWFDLLERWTFNHFRKRSEDVVRIGNCEKGLRKIILPEEGCSGLGFCWMIGLLLGFLNTFTQISKPGERGCWMNPLIKLPHPIYSSWQSRCSLSGNFNLFSLQNKSHSTPQTRSLPTIQFYSISYQLYLITSWLVTQRSRSSTSCLLILILGLQRVSSTSNSYNLNLHLYLQSPPHHLSINPFQYLCREITDVV